MSDAATDAGGTPVLFDPLVEGFAESPYEQYAALRDHDPVHRSELLQGWVVTRFDDVGALLRDPTISSDVHNATPNALTRSELRRLAEQPRAAGTIVLADDPRHARLRKLMAPPFRYGQVEHHRTMVERHVTATLDRLADEHGAGVVELDLVEAVTYPMPVGIISELLGVPEEDHPRFRWWTRCVARNVDPIMSREERAESMAGLDEMYAYLEAQVAEKVASPDDGLLSALVHAEADGERMDHEELMSQLVTLYMAGHEPTASLLGTGLLALLRAPDQLDRLRREPELLRNGIAELTRYDGPNQFVRRITTQPTRVGDTELAAGSVVYASPASANRDPRRWGDDADQVVVDRVDATKHLQFGAGPHACLGSHLARLQVEVALTMLFARLDDLELAGDPEWSTRMFIRGLAELPVRCRIRPAAA